MKKYLPHIALLLACAACGKEEIRSSLTMDEQTPQYLTHNSSTVMTEEGQLKMKMDAPVQMRYKDGNELYPDGLHIITYDPEGKIDSDLVADSAIYFAKDNVYKVMGSVVLKQPRAGKKLETEVLNYNKVNGDIYTDERFRITDAGQITTGKGLKANQKDPNSYEMNDVDGTVLLDE